MFFNLKISGKQKEITLRFSMVNSGKNFPTKKHKFLTLNKYELHLSLKYKLLAKATPNLI